MHEYFCDALEIETSHQGRLSHWTWTPSSFAAISLYSVKTASSAAFYTRTNPFQMIACIDEDIAPISFFIQPPLLSAGQGLL